MNRRTFLKSCSSILLGTAAAGFGGGIYTAMIEPEWLSVEHVSIHLPYLPAALSGFRIIQVTDIHLEPVTDKEFVQSAFDIIRRMNPDLLVLTGDYVCESADTIHQLGEILKTIRPPHGIFAVLGNHDYWTNPEVVVKGLENAGVHVLVNECAWVGSNGAMFVLAGLDDAWSGKPDLDRALRDVQPDHAVVLLAHEPDPADELLINGRVGLQLSGHTHGGQVCLPFLGPPVLPHMGEKYPSGLFQVHDSILYVSRGLGVVPPGVRLNCRPEITEITLHCPD